MAVYYLKGVVSVALPKTRCFETSYSVAFKLNQKGQRTRKMLESDPGIATAFRPNAKWITFELASDKHLAGPLK